LERGGFMLILSPMSKMISEKLYKFILALRLCLTVVLCAIILSATPVQAADETKTTTTKTVVKSTTASKPAAKKPAAKATAKTTAKPAAKTSTVKPAAKAAVAPAAVAAEKAADKATKTKPAGEPTDPADNVDAGPKLPVPRFVTLSVDEINVRTGPGVRYPIKFIIRKDGLPVEIVHEFDVWRQIRDMDGDGGWVHKTMLSGRRSVIIKGHVQPLLKKPDETAKPVVKLEPGVIADLSTCRGDWCSLKVASYNGWIRRANVWGVYPDEAFKE